MATLSFPKKTFVPTDVDLPDVLECTWESGDGMVVLKNQTNQVVGWVNSDKDLFVALKQVPGGVSNKTAVGALVDAYQAMKTAGVW
jgi:hypothetical protein